MTVDLAVSDFTAAPAAAQGTLPRPYGEALVELARQRPEVVCIGADLSGATETDLFRDSFPDRFVNIGIAEANMVGVAAGMARAGDMPFIHSFSVFVTRRCYDQIAMQVAYPRTNVKIVGFLPGLTTLLGVTHQAIDDVALMRALPNMTVIEPGDPGQIRDAVREAAAIRGPVYLRMRRPEAWETAGTAGPADLSGGRPHLLRDGSDGAILATGLMVPVALQAADALAERGRRVAVANVHRLKPLDTAFVADLARRCGSVVTAENHSIIGGLGSAVAEALMESGVAAGFARVGLQDCFAQGGSTPYLFKTYGLSVEGILAALETADARRGG